MKTIHTPISLTNENSQKCLVIPNDAPPNDVVIASDVIAFALCEAIPSFKRTIHFLLLLLFTTNFSFAGNFTWSGSTNTDWATGTNWSPNGAPSTNDTVTIVTHTNLPVLAANTTIKKFTMTSGTLDCNSYTLTISATSTFNGGTINNGTLTCSGTSTLTFAGTTFGVAVNATGNNIVLNGSKFNSTFTAVKKGTSSDNGNGGNVFNGAVSLTDSSSGNLVLSNNSASPDTFNAALTVAARSSGSIYLAHQGTGNVFTGKVTMYSSSSGRIFSNYYGTAAYGDSIVVNSTSSGGEAFGASTGSCTLASGKTVTIGSEGFSHTASSGSYGTLYFRNFVQGDATAINLTLTGSRATIKFESGCVFYGAITVSAPAIFLDGSRFLSKVNLTYTTASGYTLTSTGGNYFGDTATIVQGNSATVTMGGTAVDTFATYAVLQNTGTTFVVNNALFLGNVKFKNSLGSLSDHYYVANTGTVTIKGNATVENANSSINFGNSGGTTVLDTNCRITIPAGSGVVKLTNVVQHGPDTISIPMSVSSDLLYLNTGNVFNGPFLFNGNRIFLNGTTFNGTVNILRTSTTNDACDGGNVFNSTTVICDSVIAHSNNFYLANTTADDFNSNVTFKQYGTGGSVSSVKIYPAYTKNSTFAGNITVDGSSAIEFGANGGKIILDGSINDTLKKTGSYVPTIKKLDINKTGGAAILNLPLAITDSVLFTSGYLKTDSVNLLTIADNCIVTGASDYSAIVGPIKKVGNDAFTFPFGELWTGPPPVSAVPDYVYHPLTISAPSNATDAFTAQYFSANHNKGTNADSTIENESVCEYWKLTRTTGSSNVTVKLGWNWTSCNVYGLDSMHVAVWDSTTNKWKDKGNGGTTGTLTSGGVVSSSAFGIFGVMTLADKFCTTLKPVTTATDVTCPGNSNGTARVSASGATPPYTYNWSPRTGGSVSLWDLNAGTYHITVTDSRGCAITDSTIVNNPDSIHLSITATPSNCHDSVGTAKITATGGSSDSYYYFWTPGGETKDSIGGLPAGIYEVVVSDAKGCSVDTTVSISDSDGPDVEVDSLVNVDCNGNNSGFARIIYNGGGPIEHDPLWPCYIPNPDRIAAGTYTVMVEDVEGCFTILNVTITEPEPITLIVSTTQSECNDSTGSATVLASGGTGSFTYQWSSGGTDSVETDLASGFDTVTVTDANGCITRASAIVTDTNSMTISIMKTEVQCFDSTDGSAIVIATGGAVPYEYLWLPLLTTNDTAINLTAGEYSVLVSDSNGCKAIKTAEIAKPEKLLASLTVTAASSDSTSDGAASIEVFGGVPQYSYSWSAGGTNSFITGLSTGYDTLIITDDDGCDATLRFFVETQQMTPSQCTLSCTIPSPPSCTTCTLTTDFGATPSDGSNDQCAFESAADYFSNHSGTLIIPAGVYNVGNQIPTGGMWRQGITVLCLENATNVNIIGELNPDGTPATTIIFENCMRYGSFDPSNSHRNLPDPATWDATLSKAASLGNAIQMNHCINITIKNIDLNGNIENMSIGGYFSDPAGIVLAHNGIYIDECNIITIENVKSHHFGMDGILVEDFDATNTNAMNIVLRNCKFNQNCRSGMSWTGGNTLSAYNCEFNSNGLGPYRSPMYSGLDIEWENGNSKVGNGQFFNCRFMYNYYCGITSNVGNQPYDDRAETFVFRGCTIVSSESGFALWPNARDFHFICCDIYGGSVHAYDTPVTPFRNNWNTKFEFCNFKEEYDDGTNIFSFNLDAVDYSTWCDGTGYCSTHGHPTHDFLNCTSSHGYLVDFSNSYITTQCGRVLFNQCNFISNLQMKLFNFNGAGLQHDLSYYITVRNCNFLNYGMSIAHTTCGFLDASYGFMYKTIIAGNTNIFRAAPSRNDFSIAYGAYFDPVTVVDPIDVPVTYGQLTSDMTQCYYLPCRAKYRDPVRPYNWTIANNPATTVDEYCIDVACSLHRPTACDFPGPEERKAVNFISHEGMIKVYPNPANDKLFVEALKINDVLTLRDMMGKKIMSLIVKTKITEMVFQNLIPGIYLVESGGKISNKIVKF